MRALSTVLAALALAAGAQAAPAPPAAPAVSDPPPPASLENHDVEAWAQAYLHTEGWILVTHDLEGAHLASAKGPRRTADGLVEVDIRTELFQPVLVSRGPARSGVAHWSVDCQGKRLAVLSMTIYAHNNLAGEMGKKPDAPRVLEPANESQLVTIGVICDAARTGKGFVPKGLGPASPS